MEHTTRLMNRDFFLLWQGQLVSQIGSQGFIIATMFWVKHVTGSATLIGTLMMASSVPSVILGPIGGTFADRHSRRKIIILSDILSGIALLSLACLIFFAPSWYKIALAWVFFVCIFMSAVGSFFSPAIIAAIPDLVPEDKVARANSLSHFSVQLSTFIGQGLGGVLFSVMGAVGLFLIDGVTYLFSAFSESFITIPQVFPQKASQWKAIILELKRDILEGFHYVWKRTGMRNLFLAAAILNFFAMPIVTLLPFYVEDFLIAKADLYGFLMAAFGAGTMIGFIGAGSIKLSGKERGNLVIFCFVCASLGFALLGVFQIPVIALILMFVVGVMNGFINITITTILQITTPTEIRGRVFGILSTLSDGISPVSMGLSGLVADMINQNIPLLYILCGGISAFLSIIVSLNKDFRDFLSY